MTRLEKADRVFTLSKYESLMYFYLQHLSRTADKNKDGFFLLPHGGRELANTLKWHRCRMYRVISSLNAKGLVICHISRNQIAFRLDLNRLNFIED